MKHSSNAMISGDIKQVKEYIDWLLDWYEETQCGYSKKYVSLLLDEAYHYLGDLKRKSGYETLPKRTNPRRY